MGCHGTTTPCVSAAPTLAAAATDQTRTTGLGAMVDSAVASVSALSAAHRRIIVVSMPAPVAGGCTRKYGLWICSVRSKNRMARRAWRFSRSLPFLPLSSSRTAETRLSTRARMGRDRRQANA